MRLVGGISRGVPLMVPKRGTRPTSDKVREALFSMINNFVEDAHCLDLFAGSGSLGLEALSRGAESCVFVDIGRESCTAIKKNLEKAKFQNGIIKKQRTNSYLQYCSELFDVIFADPPYDFSDNMNNLEELFFSNRFYKLLRIDGLFILETRISESGIPSSNELALKDVRVYGDTQLNLFIRQDT